MIVLDLENVVNCFTNFVFSFSLSSAIFNFVFKLFSEESSLVLLSLFDSRMLLMKLCDVEELKEFCCFEFWAAKFTVLRLVAAFAIFGFLASLSASIVWALL